VEGPEDYDVIIVGGGINGAGVARDCAVRGFKTVLFEKGDFAGGTTGSTTGWIRGAGRYLTHAMPLAAQGAREAGILRKIAAHLTFRVPFLIPITGSSVEDRLAARILHAYLRATGRFRFAAGNKEPIRLSRDEVLALEPGLNPRICGAFALDVWGIDAPRLVILNLLSAREHGARCCNYTEVVDVIREGASGPACRVVGVRVRRPRGTIRDVRGRVVVVAAGHGAPEVGRRAGVLLVLRSTKGVHLVFERRLSNVGIMARAIDGKTVALLPHERSTLLGTTARDFYGDPDRVPITHDEVEYLLEAAERVFPSVRTQRITRAVAEVRLSPFEWNVSEDRLSFRHQIFDHGERDGVRGVFTLVGGWLSDYRLAAREITDRVARLLNRNVPCRTHLDPLPGSESSPKPGEVAREFGISPYAAMRLLVRHGSVAREILEGTREDPGLLRTICLCEPVLEAEVRYVVRREWARNLEDLSRRTGFGAGPCGSCRCIERAAQILADELDWSPEEIDHQVRRFLLKRWRSVLPVLGGAELAREELSLARHLGVEGYGRIFPPPAYPDGGTELW
jgi:glycerol-3-phosphate dehydrogenase